MKGYFITFEGTEGSGKTSIIKEVQRYFENKKVNSLVTREPGGIRISEQIREIVLGKEYTEMDSRTEALLFAASRRQHLVEKVLPALQEGKIVLCDRFIDSSLVYQGMARHIGIDEVLMINQFAIENHFPDLTIFIDVRPEVGLSRVFSKRVDEINRLDLEKISFHQNIYQSYFELMSRFPNRIKRIDGERPLDIVAQDVIDLIEISLASRKSDE